MQGQVLGSILISLHADRTKLGTLVLKNHKGETLFSCQCLGHSAGHASNPSRDPMRHRGNTPVGKFATTHISHLPHAVIGIGSLWCPLDPDNFYDTQARRAEIAGRDGLGIHGGRGNFIHKMTHGCVRLLDRDMQDFARIAGKLRFTVEIKEVA
jgi:L,D-transpeptidase catalytic domain